MKVRQLMFFAALLSCIGVVVLWFHFADKIDDGFLPRLFSNVSSEPKVEALSPSHTTAQDAKDSASQVTKDVKPSTPSTPSTLPTKPASTQTEAEKTPPPPALSLPAMQGSKGAQELIDTLAKTLTTSSGQPEAEQGAKVLKALEKAEFIPKKDADILREWQKNNRPVHVEPVGTLIQGKDGKKLTRYRIVGDKGQDLLIDLEQTPQKKWIVQRVQAVSTHMDQDKIDLNDSMQVVDGFIRAVRRGDMSAAQSYLIGQEVSDVTIAGLCMIFEEGGYQLRSQNPIRASFQNETSAAYLVYLQGSSNTLPANIGVEMKQEQGWHVAAVSLDSLLSNYEQSAEAEGGRYFPLVKNLQGGDSLALFFAFDDSKLTARSISQLKIVAQLMNQKDRNLDISGHTDDVGGVTYNERLSMRRAQAVKAALVELGVDEHKITTKGMGMRQPRRSYKALHAPLNLDVQRAENRRAEIYLDFH